MSRLIDADTLMEEIKTLRVSVTGLRAGKGILAEYAKQYRESLLRIIDEQPTAYNTDKVVAELEERRANHDCRYCKYNKTEKQVCEQDCTDALIDDLFDIVKRGGWNESIKQKATERDIAQSDFIGSVKH